MRTLLAILVSMAFANAAGAVPQLACHYTYGGETKHLQQPRLASVAEAYRFAPSAIGSYFLFRPVFEPDAVKLYTYADQKEGPVLVHQATFSYPEATESRGRFGFTGMQRVYEPIRDSELRYWCEILPAGEVQQ